MARRMASLIPLDSGAKVLEIGPGKGRLTQALRGHSFQVLAVERDPALGLSMEGAGKELRIVVADILEFGLSRAAKAGYCYVVGNLPYHLECVSMGRNFWHYSQECKFVCRKSSISNLFQDYADSFSTYDHRSIIILPCGNIRFGDI